MHITNIILMQHLAWMWGHSVFQSPLRVLNGAYHTRFLNSSDMLPPWNFVPGVYIYLMLPSTGIPHVIELCFIVLYICCTFYKLMARCSSSKPITAHFFFFLNTCFAKVAWNQIRSITKYAYVLSPFYFLQSIGLSGQGFLLLVQQEQFLYCCLSYLYSWLRDGDLAFDMLIGA